MSNILPVEERVNELIEVSLLQMGYEIVRIRFRGGKSGVLQIMIERCDGVAITLDDCETVSRHVSALLDVEDPFPERYRLEISSPGIERPLAKMKDFEKFKGYDIKLHTQVPIQGSKVFTGKLAGTLSDKGKILLIIEEKNSSVTLEIDYSNVQDAKLVATDAMIKKLLSG